MSEGINGNEEQERQHTKRRKSIQDALATEALSIYGSHPPLDASKKEIRLLSLHNTEDATAPLSGELRLASMEDNYTAVSYVWGDWCNRRPIRLNSIDTTITASLEIVLRQLRNEKKAVDIWIDAVCINQTDNTEKGHQVQKMGDIYQYAKKGTILWLGEIQNNSGEAMELISTANQTFFDEYNPKVPSPALQAVEHLLKREWWKRMWVIQETMLSPNPIVKVGPQEVPFERFVVFRNLHWYSERADVERFRPLRNLWRECPFTPMLEYNYKDWIGKELATWMLDVPKFQCQHLRDKVYALLGLIAKEIKDQITVEYDSTIKSDRMVFLEATRLCFLEAGLLPLQLRQVDKETSLGLPSWCSDWNSKAADAPFIGFGFSPFPAGSSFRPPAENWLFGGNLDEKPTFRFSADKEILFLHGFVVDTVDFVDGVGTEEEPEVPAYTGNDVEIGAQLRAKRQYGTKKACLRWNEQVQASKSSSYHEAPGGYEEAFYRTIVANRTFGKKEFNSDVKPIFDAWVGQDGTSPIPKPEHAKRILDYNNSVVSRCVKRAFITTTKGYFGLAPRTTKVGDLVCVVYSGEVVYILRNPEPDGVDTPGSFVGESYIHGIMQGEYLDTAKGEDFTALWLK
jgi:Heterokaryon incompatibility protein (HET)